MISPESLNLKKCFTSSVFAVARKTSNRTALLPPLHSSSVVLVRLLGPFSVFLGKPETKKQKANKHCRLHHWHPLASRDIVPNILCLKRSPAFSPLSNAGFLTRYVSALTSKNANPRFFLLSNLPNKRWRRAASESLGVSRSKRKLGCFEAECFCGLCCHWDVATTVSSFLLKYVFKKRGISGCNLLLQVHLSLSSAEMRRTPTGSSHLSAFFHSTLNELLAGG